MILLLDNYDSFVFNLARYLLELGQEVEVVRSDALAVADVRALDPAAIVLSPGPGRPESAGISVPLVRELSGSVPILGVCLGHQAIAVAFGGHVLASGRPRHGVVAAVCHDGRGVFRGLPSPFSAGRYHSLVVDRNRLPECLEVSATAQDAPGQRTIMALRHRDHATVGVQFHPESILTVHGHRLMAGFLELGGLRTSCPEARGGVLEVT